MARERILYEAPKTIEPKVILVEGRDRDSRPKMDGETMMDLFRL